MDGQYKTQNTPVTDLFQLRGTVTVTRNDEAYQGALMGVTFFLLGFLARKT